MHISIDTQRRDTILAALRVYQHWLEGTPPDHRGVMDIATNGNDHPPMTIPQIDELCEEINQ